MDTTNYNFSFSFGALRDELPLSSTRNIAEQQACVISHGFEQKTNFHRTEHFDLHPWFVTSVENCLSVSRIHETLVIIISHNNNEK